MKTAAAIETYQFACRGSEWFLRRVGVAGLVEIYLNMSRERALIHAVDRLKGCDGLLRIHDEGGFLTEVRSFGGAMRGAGQAMAA